MIQSAPITCLSYIIQTSFQLTTAHYLTIEKCVNVQKSPTEKCDVCANIHMKNVNDADFDTNINLDMCMKVMILFIDIKPRIVDKYIYLYHAYCYLHHLCAR